MVCALAQTNNTQLSEIQHNKTAQTDYHFIQVSNSIADNLISENEEDETLNHFLFFNPSFYLQFTFYKVQKIQILNPSKSRSILLNRYLDTPPPQHI